MPATQSPQSKAVFAMTTYDHLIFGSGKLHFFKYKKWIRTHYRSGDRPFYPFQNQVYTFANMACSEKRLRVTCQFIGKVLWQCLDLPRDFGSLKSLQSQLKLDLDLSKSFFLQIEGTSMVLRGVVWMSVVCCAMGRGRQGTSQRFSIARAPATAATARGSICNLRERWW